MSVATIRESSRCWVRVLTQEMCPEDLVMIGFVDQEAQYLGIGEHYGNIGAETGMKLHWLHQDPVNY